jgi:hypothetical protein
MAGVLRKSLVPALLRFKTVSQMVTPQASKVMSTYVGMGSGGRRGGWAVRSPPDDIPFAIKALKHIAIAVPDLSIAAEHYRTAFGAQVSDPVVCNCRSLYHSLPTMHNFVFVCKKVACFASLLKFFLFVLQS